MSKYDVDFEKLIAEILPPKKRKPVRIAFIFRLLSWFRRIQLEFIAVYNELSYQATITSQVIVFEGHLVDQFGVGITITTNEIPQVSSVVVSSSDDGQGGAITSSEQSEFDSSVRSDSEAFGAYNFTVNVPLSLSADLDQMRSIIDRYKVPGSTYNIIES